MYVERIACLVLCIVFGLPNGFAGVHIPRMGAVVTNDLSVSEFKSCFETVETSATNLVLVLKGNVNGLRYEVSSSGEANMCRGGEKICLGINQALCVGDGRHVSLVVKGYADDATTGFELVKVFDARAFGRGIAILYGRLLLRSKNREIRENDIVIVGAKELNLSVGGLRVDSTEIGKIKSFFKDLVETYNKKDINRLKKLSGGAYERLSRWMDADELLGGVDVLGCHEGDAIAVSAEITLLGRGDDPYTFPVTIVLIENEGTYQVEEISLSDRWNRLLDKTIEASEALIKAINQRDLIAVKGLLYDGRNGDLVKILSERGLMWIKAAVDRHVEILQSRMVVKCVLGKQMVGEIPVPCGKGGTNIIRRVVFVGGKIKCADDIERRGTKMEFSEWLKTRQGKRKIH